MSLQYNEKQTESFALGTSVYGGRPTFALIRHEEGNNVTLTLYELLPAGQADARHRRFERRRQQASKTAPFDEVIGDDVGLEGDWSWDDWVAVKVSRLSGSRLRSVLQLLDESLRKTNVNPAEVTGTGSSTVLLNEDTGIRLSLGFIGVKPLKRVDRMRSISRGVARMSIEECYYWYAKCRSPKFPNGSQALRVLLKHD